MTRTGYPGSLFLWGRDNARLMFEMYTYDESLNISRIQDFAVNQTLDLGYDNQNRLVTAISGAIGKWQFDYDARDNVTSINRGGVISDYYYNQSANLLDRVESAGQRRNFQYDSRGNVKNNGNSSIQYMANNHVVSVGNESYIYDGNGRRALTRTSSGNKIYQFYDQGGSLRYRYDAGAQTHSEYHYVAGKLLARRDTGNRGSSSSGGDSTGGSGSSGGATAVSLTPRRRSKSHGQRLLIATEISSATKCTETAN